MAKELLLEPEGFESVLEVLDIPGVGSESDVLDGASLDNYFVIDKEVTYAPVS